jgi:hypothetical protein
VAASHGSHGKDRLFRPDRPPVGSGAGRGLTTTANIDGVPNGRLRECACLRPATNAIWQANRLIPDDAGRDRKDARQRYGLSVHDAPPRADGDALGTAKHVERDVLELDAEVLGDQGAPCHDGDVFEHCLSPVAEARRLDCRHL